MWRGVFHRMASANLPCSSVFVRAPSSAASAKTSFNCGEFRPNLSFATKTRMGLAQNCGRYDGRRNWRKFKHPGIIYSSFFVMLAAVEHKKDTNIPTGSISVPNDNKDIAELIKKGQHMMNTKCRPAKVEEVYTEALHLALDRKDKSAIAFVQDRLANLALWQGQLEKAEKLFRNVIRNLLDTGMKEADAAIIEISLKLATIYASAKKDELATTGYEWVIEKCRENLNSSDSKSAKNVLENLYALLGMSLDSYGRYLYTMGKNEKALIITKEACEISTKLFGEKDIRTLILFNDIGAILSVSGKYDEAAKIIEKAIQITSKTSSVEHSDIAIFWLNLASVYKKQGKEKEMSDAFKNCRGEAELSKDKNLQDRIEKFIQQVNPDDSL